MSHFGNHVVGIVVAIGAWKDENPEFHASRVSASDDGSSILHAPARFAVADPALGATMSGVGQVLLLSPATVTKARAVNSL
jgi:hypothetical protein